MNSTVQHNYVISLSTKQDRRNHITQEFGKQNIPFEFFDAITPDLIEDKARKFGIDLTNTPLTEREVACAMSHIALWHKLLNENLDYICIFEDDIYLGKTIKSFLLNIDIHTLPHIIKLEKHGDRIKVSRKPEKIIGDRGLYRLNSPYYGAAGYIISRKGVRYLLEKLKLYHLSIPIDDLMFDRLLADESYQVLQVIPALTIQDFMLHKNTKLESSLKDGRDQRLNHNQKRKKKTLLYKLKREILRPLEKIAVNLSTKYVKFK